MGKNSLNNIRNRSQLPFLLIFSIPLLALVLFFIIIVGAVLIYFLDYVSPEIQSLIFSSIFIILIISAVDKKRKQRRLTEQRRLEEQKKLQFERKQRANGLVKFVDRFGGEKWGTSKQVIEWKKIDFGLKNNFADYSPRKFEFLIGELFKKMDYEVTVARYSKDYGIDLICKKPNETVVVEVKKWQKGNNVGNETVRSILGAMLKIKADKAILVTTSDFTVSAEEQAGGLPVELWNNRKLSKLMEKYFIT